MCSAQREENNSIRESVREYMCTSICLSYLYVTHCLCFPSDGFRRMRRDGIALIIDCNEYELA